jgi:hypothetical protein
MPDIDEEVLGRPIPKPRRTKAQIAADNVAAAKKKSLKAEEVKLNKEKKAELLASVAILEKRIEDDERQAEREAAHPPANTRIVMTVKPPTKRTNTHLFKCV